MGGPPPYPCGTRAAYQRHRRRGEEPCPPCVEAEQEYHRAVHAANRDDRRAYAALYGQADRILSDRHRDEYEHHRDRYYLAIAEANPDLDYRRAYSRAVSKARTRVRRDHRTEHAIIVTALRQETQP